MKDFLLRAAVRKLYESLDERYVLARNMADHYADQYEKGCWRGEQIACSKIRQEMRTLFAGLIDFDE